MPFRVRYGRPIRNARPEMVAYRKKNNLSQGEAARKARLSQTAWGLMEQGHRNPSVPTAKRLARLLGMSAARILRLEPARRAS